MAPRIRHQEIGHRGAFFIERDGTRVAAMTDSRASASLVSVDHTAVAPSLGGQGIDRCLLDAVVDRARDHDTKVVATCPIASPRFASNPSIRDVVA